VENGEFSGLRGSMSSSALSKLARSTLSKGGPIVIPALRKAVLEHDSERDESYLHASGLEDYCPRLNVISHIFGIKVETGIEISFQLGMTFEIGHAIHSRIQNKLLGERVHKVLGLWVCPFCLSVAGGVEPKHWQPCPSVKGCTQNNGRHFWRFVESSNISDRLKIGGSIDGGIYNYDKRGNKVLSGLEIKTISEKGFNRLNKVMPGHVRQAQIYMYLFNLPMQTFIYVSKGWHEPSEKIEIIRKNRLKDVQGWRCGPVFETVVYRDEALITQLVEGRKAELAAYESLDAGFEEYPQKLPECKSRMATKAKNCPAAHICFDLEKK